MAILLDDTIKKISCPDKKMKKMALKRLRDQARPAGSLGRLETIAAKIAAIKGKMDVRFKSKKVVVCAGDHGIAAEGVSLFLQEVTKKMVENFVAGGASVNVIANHASAEVLVADIGVNADFDSSLPIFHKKVKKGTDNFSKMPAMSKDEAVQAIENGIDIVKELIDKDNVDLLATGDMGIANTTPSAAIISVFSQQPVAEVTGKGTGIDNQMLNHKINVIKKAIEFHKPDKNDPIDVLSKIGGLEIGAIAGLVLGAAANKIPVIADGLISTAGAVIACELCPKAKEYLFAGHRSVEAGHKIMHQYLQLEPIIDLGMRLGEGTGAAIAMNILDIATRVLADIKTFAETTIVDPNL